MDLKEMLSKVLNTEGEDRAELARKSLARALAELPKFEIPKDNYGTFIIALVKLFVRADRSVTYEDYSFVSDVLNLSISAQEFNEKMNDTSDSALMAWLDNLIDRFSPEGKEAVCTFGLCIMESDDVLTREEQSVFERLLK